MKQYLQLMNKILKEGKLKKNRTGIDTLSLFGYQMRFNLNIGFPLLTTKRCNIASIIYELLWFLKGDTNVQYLKKNNVSIWNAWANSKGDLGPIYGKQWRKWETADGKYIDQIKKILKQLKYHSESRRIIVSSWNVGELNNMALMPCHILFQLYVSNNKELSCQVYQRSCDVFLGLPFNIASYSLLVHMLAQQANLLIGEFIWTGGDVHLYYNHLEQTKLQLSRKPRNLPKLVILNKPSSIFKYSFKDFKIINYNPYPSIKASIAI